VTRTRFRSNARWHETARRVNCHNHFPIKPLRPRGAGLISPPLLAQGGRGVVPCSCRLSTSCGGSHERTCPTGDGLGVSERKPDDDHGILGAG
jgi:hypothetical protein